MTRPGPSLTHWPHESGAGILEASALLRAAHCAILSRRNNCSASAVLGFCYPSWLSSQLQCATTQGAFSQKRNSTASHGTGTIPMCLFHLHSIEGIDQSLQQFAILAFHSQVSNSSPRLHSDGHQVNQLTKSIYTQIRSQCNIPRLLSTRQLPDHQVSGRNVVGFCKVPSQVMCCRLEKQCTFMVLVWGRLTFAHSLTRVPFLRVLWSVPKVAI